MNNKVLIYSIIFILLTILSVIANWKVFEKANEKGWKSLIPIYASYINFKIIYGNGWLFLTLAPLIILMLIPSVNIVATIVTLVWGFLIYYHTAKIFNKGILFAIGLFFLPFVFNLILAFGDSKYIGPLKELKKEKTNQ